MQEFGVCQQKKQALFFLETRETEQNSRFLPLDIIFPESTLSSAPNASCAKALFASVMPVYR